MSSEELRGILITPKFISATVGLATLLGLLIGGIVYVVKQDFRIEQVATQMANLESRIDRELEKTDAKYEKILQKVDQLTSEITKLTIALRNVQYKQDNTTDAK